MLPSATLLGSQQHRNMPQLLTPRRTAVALLMSKFIQQGQQGQTCCCPLSLTHVQQGSAAAKAGTPSAGCLMCGFCCGEGACRLLPPIHIGFRG